MSAIRYNWSRKGEGSRRHFGGKERDLEEREGGEGGNWGSQVTLNWNIKTIFSLHFPTIRRLAKASPIPKPLRDCRLIANSEKWGGGTQFIYV